MLNSVGKNDDKYAYLHLHNVTKVHGITRFLALIQQKSQTSSQ